MLSCCLTTYSTSNPLYVETNGKDTTVVLSMDEIRELDKKLVERKYLIKITETQDSIINNQKEYIQEQEKLAKASTDKIKELDSLHRKMVNKSNIMKGTSICLGVALAVSLLVNILK